ncbi:MAG: ATP-binding protein [Rhodobacteraceae bacterium]|nr:ATP-binding protein [Paracoccaceae bacterium]
MIKEAFRPHGSELELTPSPAILIESLRDMGYSLKTAIADIIDNSIAAGATEIQLLADTNVDNPAIGVLDNGCGMSWKQLREAMRPGSQNPLWERESNDLGRFGLGLKTASFSQCRRATVLTRQNGVTSCAIWDLDSVAKNDRWTIEIPNQKDKVRWSRRLKECGTLVVWEKLDRLVGSSDRQDLVRQLDAAATHLSCVFHHFLTGSERIRRICLSMNGSVLEPLDPFHSNHGATQHHSEEVMMHRGQMIRIRPVTLPHHAKVSVDDWQRYALQEGYVSNQGFYLYRNHRLIVHGTWFRLARKKELTKLARVGIFIPNTMDAEWKIDVKKASAQPPTAVRKRLSKIIDKMAEGSQRVYTARGAKQTSTNQLPVWIRRKKWNQISYDIDTGNPAFKQFKNGLSSAQGKQFVRLLRLVASALPIQSLHNDVSSHPETVHSSTLASRDLLHIVSTICDVLVERGHSCEEIKKRMRTAEPFRSQWSDTERLIEDHVAGRK